jgi:hypothetical protein
MLFSISLTNLLGLSYYFGVVCLQLSASNLLLKLIYIPFKALQNR